MRGASYEGLPPVPMVYSRRVSPGRVVVAGAIGGFGVVGGRAEQTAKPVAAALADTVTFHGGRGFTCSRARAGR